MNLIGINVIAYSLKVFLFQSFTSYLLKAGYFESLTSFTSLIGVDTFHAYSKQKSPTAALMINKITIANPAIIKI